MEKLIPHTRLSQVKELVLKGKVRAPRSALENAGGLGLIFQDICNSVRSLTTADFHKSMTTHQDHTILQEIYRPRLACGHVYLKITVIKDVLIVSLKEL